MRCLLFVSLLAACFNASAANCDIHQFSDFAICVKNDTTAVLRADVVLAPNQTIVIDGVSNFSIDGNDNGVKHKIDESAARFQANNAQSGEYVRVSNALDIAIRNVLFRSTPATDAACMNQGTYYGSYPCTGMVTVKNSTGVDLVGNDFAAHKTFQLQLVDASSMLISDNHFSDAATFGIWMTSYSGKLKALQITDNNFERSGANAILASGVDDLWVGNNTFTNNHRLTQYSGFGGGQLLIEEAQKYDTKNVDVTGNSFLTSGVSTSSGIEFANFDGGHSLKNVQVIWNIIQNNGRGAVVFDKSNNNSKLVNVKIANNSFLFNNSIYKGQSIFSAFDGLAIGNNWVESSNALVDANFDATSPTCTLAPGQSHCTIDIKWDVHTTRGGPLRVMVKDPGSQVGSKDLGYFAGFITGSGHQQASWISATGAVFELYFDDDYAKQYGWEAPVASVFVKAVAAP
jgi:hypothetical protein